MPVNSQHPDYKKHLSVWQKCRDAANGEQAIKERGQVYLPPLTAHLDGLLGQEAYERYKARATWFGATGRTIQGYVGAIMRNEPGFRVPAQLKERMKNLTGNGQSAAEVVHTCVEELVTTARLGLLVDTTENSSEPPYIRIYDPETIINWKLDAAGKLVMVVLQEMVLEPCAGDEFAQEEVVQYRVLRLDAGVYTQELHREQADKKSEFDVVKVVTPSFRRKPLSEIPFYFISLNKDPYSVSRPPLLSLIDANIAHYQLDADLRHGLHFTALPTAVFTGVGDGDAYHLGSETAIKLNSDTAKASFLEFSGTGLSSIREAKNELKSQMASLGAQLLQRGERGRGVETAEAARVQHSGETSMLSVVVARVEEALERALLFAAQWAGAQSATTEDIEVNVNRDFIDSTLSAADITALTGAYQNGTLDVENLYWNFLRGGVVDPKASLEDFKAGLEARKADRGAEGQSQNGVAQGQGACPVPGVQPNTSSVNGENEEKVS